MCTPVILATQEPSLTTHAHPWPSPGCLYAVWHGANTSTPGLCELRSRMDWGIIGSLGAANNVPGVTTQIIGLPIRPAMLSQAI